MLEKQHENFWTMVISAAIRVHMTTKMASSNATEGIKNIKISILSHDIFIINQLKVLVKWQLITAMGGGGLVVAY